MPVVCDIPRLPTARAVLGGSLPVGWPPAPEVWPLRLCCTLSFNRLFPLKQQDPVSVVGAVRSRVKPARALGPRHPISETALCNRLWKLRVSRTVLLVTQFCLYSSMGGTFRQPLRASVPVLVIPASHSLCRLHNPAISKCSLTTLTRTLHRGPWEELATPSLCLPGSQQCARGSPSSCGKR